MLNPKSKSVLDLGFCALNFYKKCPSSNGQNLLSNPTSFNLPQQPGLSNTDLMPVKLNSFLYKNKRVRRKFGTICQQTLTKFWRHDIMLCQLNLGTLPSHCGSKLLLKNRWVGKNLRCHWPRTHVKCF